MHMPDYGREKMEAAWEGEEYEERGKALQVLGWVLGCMGGITSVWIWVGWRAGTEFWLWWTLGLGLLGMILNGRGAWLRARSAEIFTGIRGNMRAGSAQPLGTAGLPSPGEDERRAA
jgi:hypothetical protein